MTIKPHEEWGHEMASPEDLHVAADDADLARRFDAAPG